MTAQTQMSGSSLATYPTSDMASISATPRVKVGGLQVASVLFDMVNKEILPGTGVDEKTFWTAMESIATDLNPKRLALLAKRDELQAKLDDWHIKNGAGDFPRYKQFLQEIGYLVPEGPDFQITTESVDPEIAIQAGPQLVSPIMNTRFAINAANARWGSLYSALYNSDMIPENQDSIRRKEGFNPVRGESEIAFGRLFLDQSAPLVLGSHSLVTKYFVADGKLQVTLKGGDTTELANPELFVGYRGQAESPESILLCHNRIHIELLIDPNSEIGKLDNAGVRDILIEAALTTIMDLEDSVAVVDGEDKVACYRNWLGLMTGKLECTIHKDGHKIIRKLNADPSYIAADGSGEFSLKGRSMLFIRNVGLLMNNPAILDKDGHEFPEGMMDAMITTLAAIHDLKGQGQIAGKTIHNSTANSINVVLPKIHGPEEVALVVEMYSRIEKAFKLPKNTVKLGIMDEERRTSVNLKECIRAASERVVFINTGFLDRTGDEIRTSMEAGPFAPKSQLKHMKWIDAYEDNNVDVGLGCGLQGKAQIGKGMWAMPDLMHDMYKQKITHPQQGANTAWVPSPIAATIHALHYHKVDVPSVQDKLKTRPKANVDDILNIPLLGDMELTAEDIQQELNNNAQGILGYVVRWTDLGIGCSKVPNINNVGLMEDRATLRISSQHIANWLHHGLVSKDQVINSLKQMAAVVDEQNAHEPSYHPMGPNFDGIAFRAACDLIFEGPAQPNGYTEPLLHAHRLALKATPTVA